MTDDHPTPEGLRRYFDDWDDPCPLRSSEMYCLLREWDDPTFANIPYSKPMPWIEKAIVESRRGKRIVLLVRVDPSTKWWMKLVAARAQFAFFHGRLDFLVDGRHGAFPYASALVFLPDGDNESP